MAGHRILVVDHDPGTQRDLDLILSEAGYEVILARNAAEGVRLCRDLEPDLVLLDVLMPGNGGLETIVELRAFDPRLRIVALGSAEREHSRLDLLGDAQMLGAVSAIEKPFTPAEVIATVRRALSQEKEP